MEQAMQEDLSWVLFRNSRVQMNPDFSLTVDFDLLDEVSGDENEILPADTYRMRVRHAGFYHKGVEITERNSFAFSLLLATPDSTSFRRTGKQTCQQVFRPLADHGFSLMNVLVAQLSLMHSGPLDWHRILIEPLPSS
jgi:hypothetical protein